LYASRFGQFGDVADLDKAIEVHEKSSMVIQDGEERKADSLVASGMLYAQRFRLFGAAADIDKAISTCKDAIQIIPNDSPKAAYVVQTLGTMFGVRFDRFEDVADIDMGIELLEKALQTTTNEVPFELGCLTSICTSYVLRFEYHNHSNLADVDKAIAANSRAVLLVPPNHPGNVVLQSQRCCAYGNRYKWSRDATDIKAAILAGEYVLRMVHANDPKKPIHLINLGKSYLYRFEHLHNIGDINEAILHFRDAAHCATGIARDRFQAALEWAKCALRADGSSSLEAHSCALDLLPRVAWLGLPMTERHRELTKIGSAVRDAAAAAIASGEYGQAVEWLEQGRSVVWGQLLNLRTPVHQLREKRPDLATRLQHVTTLLALGDSPDIVIDSSHLEPVQRPVEQHIELARKWEELVKQIREVEGFEDFLLPKKMAQLRAAARWGPVVVINVHSLHCDALIVRHDRNDVTHVPLDHFSFEQAKGLQSQLEKLLPKSGLTNRSGRLATEWDPSSDELFMDILSTLWTNVVNPIRESLGLSVCFFLFYSCSH
jgi:tetratricopeptide (TPR) repeat protein